jgi:hypothetical protein
MPVNSFKKNIKTLYFLIKVTYFKKFSSHFESLNYHTLISINKGINHIKKKESLAKFDQFVDSICCRTF